MAQHNTDYGLVYDDEGKICVTKRTDIIPFSGVTSYAVETATTNLIGHTNGRFNSVTCGGTTPPTVELVSKKTPWGNEAWKVTIPANNDTGFAGCRVVTGPRFPVVADTYYSYFTYVLFEGSLNPSDVTIYPTGIAGMDSLILDSSKNIGMWQYFFRENQAPVATGTNYLSYHVNTTSTVARTFYIAVGQFEQKPFCSSFVIGSRPTGKLVVDVEDLGFNPGTDDWVVSYRKYPIATRDDTLRSYSLCSLGAKSNGYYSSWGAYNNNTFVIRTNYNDGTYIQVYSPTFNPDDYFRHWHSEVVLKHNGAIDYWVDGVLQCQATLTKSLSNYSDVGLSLGRIQGFNPNNSLFANITYGKYTDQWTPEYIQRISAMTSTFYVPTKRVIV